MLVDARTNVCGLPPSMLMPSRRSSSCSVKETGGGVEHAADTAVAHLEHGPGHVAQQHELEERRGRP